MFTIDSTPDTDRVLESMINGNFIKRNVLPKIDLVEFGIIAKEAIQQHLNASMPDKAKHFKITLSGTNQYGLNIKVVTDDLGNLLMEGSPQHFESPKGLAVKFQGSDGPDDIVFASIVDHPGFTGVKDEVNQIIRQAVKTAMLVHRG